MISKLNEQGLWEVWDYNGNCYGEFKTYKESLEFRKKVK